MSVAVSELEMVALDPEALSLDGLEHQMKSHGAHIASAMCRFLLLVAEYDRRRGYERWEAMNCAIWLGWHCSLSPNTAREYVRVARRLVELPEVRAAFASGALSYSKVRAITRVATASTEKELVELAMVLSAANLERTVRTLERALAERTDEEMARVEAQRGADHWRDDHGVNTLLLRMADEEMAAVWSVVSYVRDLDFAAAKAELADPEAKISTRRGHGLPLLDSLLGALELGMQRAVEGEFELAERYQVIVHYEGEPTVDGSGYVTLGNGIRLHPKTASQLGCDAGIQLAHSCEDGGMHLGRKIRTFTRNQRRAIAFRYPVCGFPGCEVRAVRCQFHHVVPWENGGLTDIENGVPLCRHHHRAVHQGGWRMFKEGGGTIVVIAPDGRRLRGDPPVTTVADAQASLEEVHARLGVEVTLVEPALERGSIDYVIDCVLGNAHLNGREWWDRHTETTVSLN
jgi:hypothetical protein